MRENFIFGIVQLFGGLGLIMLSLKITNELERHIAIFGVMVGIANVIMGVIGIIYGISCVIFA